MASTDLDDARPTPGDRAGPVTFVRVGGASGASMPSNGSPALLQVPERSRWSQLEMWCKAGKYATGRGMVMALNRVSEIAGLHLGEVDVAGVPKRRLIALAKEGRNETATKLDRLPYEKKITTLLATVRWLEFSAIAISN